MDFLDKLYFITWLLVSSRALPFFIRELQQKESDSKINSFESTRISIHVEWAPKLQPARLQWVIESERSFPQIKPIIYSYFCWLIKTW